MITFEEKNSVQFAMNERLPIVPEPAFYEQSARVLIVVNVWEQELGVNASIVGIITLWVWLSWVELTL